MDNDILTMLRASAEGFLKSHHESERKKGIRNLPDGIDRRVWGEMAQLGWLGLGIPEHLGGSGMGLEGAAELAMLFGKTVFPQPFIGACVMPAAILSRACASALAHELARDMVEGRRVLTVAWQERAGEVILERPTVQLLDGKVRGSKLFVPAVEQDGVLLVYVNTPQGSAIVAVAGDGERVRTERYRSGMGTFSTVHFDDAPILGEQALLGGPEAEGALNDALNSARIALSAQLTGVATEALNLSIRHVRDRIQFGRQIGSFQTIQHQCVNLLIGVRLADASWRHAMRVFQKSRHAGETSAAISAAKARASDVALQVTRATIQMHGAMGFTDEAEPGFFLRAAMHGSAWLGTAPIHRRRFRETHNRESLHV